MTQTLSNAVLRVFVVICAVVYTTECTPVLNATAVEGNATVSDTTANNATVSDRLHSENVTHSLKVNTTSKPGCLKKRTTANMSVVNDYDEVGAKNFIVVTVVVYALVGTLTLLLLRVCRRARRVHKNKDRMEELVNNYLRVSGVLKDEGDRYRMLCEAQRTALTLTSMSRSQRQDRPQRNIPVELDSEEGDIPFCEVGGGSELSLNGIKHAETSFSESPDHGGHQKHPLLGRTQQRSLTPIDEIIGETT